MDLSRIFSLSEASVVSLAQRHGVSIDLATHVNKLDRANADVLLSVYTNSDASFSEVKDESDIDTFDNWYYGYGVQPSGERISRFLGHFKHAGKEIVKLVNSSDDSPLDVVSRFITDRTDNRDIPNEKNLATVTFPDGSYWYQLRDKDECALEGDLVQHCGRPLNNDGVMYSLRTVDGKPVVTVETSKEQGKTWDLGKHAIVQVKGKQNTVPDRKYWPYVERLYKELDLAVDPDAYGDSLRRSERELLTHLDGGEAEQLHRKMATTKSESVMRHWLKRRMSW